MELYNKKLDITDDTVINESSILKLTEWRNHIQLQIIEVKERLSKITDGDEIVRATHAKKYMNYLAQLIDGRIRVLKAENHKEILLMRKFMKIAKKKIGSQLYKEILAEAKVLAKYNEESDDVADII